MINNKVINRLNFIFDTNNAAGDAVFTSMVGFDWADWEERFRKTGRKILHHCQKMKPNCLLAPRYCVTCGERAAVISPLTLMCLNHLGRERAAGVSSAAPSLSCTTRTSDIISLISSIDRPRSFLKTRAFTPRPSTGQIKNRRELASSHNDSSETHFLFQQSRES